MSAFCEERHYCLRFIIFAFLQWRTRRQTKGCHGTKRREVKEIRSCCRCSRKGAARFFFFFFLFGPFTRFFIYPIFTNDKTSPTSIIARSFAFRTKRHATVAFQPTFAPPWERRLNRDRKESRERGDLTRWSFADNGERVFSSEFHVRLKCTRCLPRGSFDPFFERRSREMKKDVEYAKEYYVCYVERENFERENCGHSL